MHIYFFRQEQNELLAVVDWNQKLSFYQLCGKQVNLNLLPGVFSRLSEIKCKETVNVVKQIEGFLNPHDC